MDRPLVPRLVFREFRFSVLWRLFILGLLCVQSAGTSRSSSCDLSRQFPCRTSPHICIELSRIRDGRSDCPDGSDEECPEGMHRCVCGLPRCVERNKVGDGIKNCQDGSDEGEDGSNYLCPESSGEENLFAVEMKKRRRRHIGLRNDPVVYPTGLISTFVGTEVNGDRTTLHTTQRYRTYVDGSYTELLQSTSVIVPTPTVEAAPGMETTANIQRFGSLNSGKVYLTAINEPVSAISSGYDGPIKISGTFIPPQGPITTKHFGLDLQAQTIGTLFPDRTGSSIITVTGTKGTFVSPESTTERIYPVYTGSYISGQENPTTYKFFFGNHPLTSEVHVILPSAVEAGADFTENYEAEESELQASLTRRKDSIDNLLFDSGIDKEVPEPFYRSQNKSQINYSTVPTSRPEANPIVVTRFVQPTAYPETDEPVLAVAGRNTIGIVGNILKPPAPSTLRGHHGHYRQGGMYNPSATGRRIGQNEPTVVADQYFFPGHRIETVDENADLNIQDFNNEYYNINDERVQDQIRKIVRPTATYRNSLKDSRLTRTVGLYGPIYEMDDLKDTKSIKSDDALESAKDSVNDDTEDTDFTTTLYGFADFSTRISGTNYIFLPASTRPRTFTPRVTRTSFTSGIAIAPKSQSVSMKTDTITEAFFRKPLFGTETREFISQNSMFTSTVKEPVEIQKTMFTSTVATKQISDGNFMARKFDDSVTKSIIAETLPLNLATVYESDSFRSRHADNRDLFLNFKSFQKYDHMTSSPIELDVSEIIETKESDAIEPAYPTGLVSSITGTEVSDGTTTHWTTLIFGTYIDNTYAHVIESTSSIFFTVSKTISPEETLAMDISSDNESNLDMSYNKLTSGEVFSPGSNIELISSFTDLSSSPTVSYRDIENNVLATPSLEILTSGFILPRSGRNDGFESTFSLNPTETSAILLPEETSLFPEKSEFVTPGVIYLDDETSVTTEAESSEEESVHIITDSFILPGSLAVVPSATSKEFDDSEKKEDELSINSKMTSTYLNDLDRLIVGLPAENNLNENSNSDFVDSVVMEKETEKNKINSFTEEPTGIVLLTGDFILPSIPIEELQLKPSENLDSVYVPPETSTSILTDGFILPSPDVVNETPSSISPIRIDASPTTSSLSILTDGFILPGENKVIESLETEMPVVHALPSSALLTADYPSDEDINEIGGRSAGEDDKEIIYDNPMHTNAPSAILYENTEIFTKEKNPKNDHASRQGKTLYSVEESEEKPQADKILSSISFPITYFTTSTYFTTYLMDGSTEVSSRKATVSHVYTDSEHLKLAKINPTETIIMPDTIRPTRTEGSEQQFTTFTYYTTFYKDGSKIVSSRVETDSDNMEETPVPEIESQPAYSVLTYPTTYYTTLTYFTTLLKGDSSEVISSETIVSNVVTPNAGYKENVSPNLAATPSKSSLHTPTTYFTTYTYYTTFHKDGTTSVSTNYQTVSNVIYGNENIVSTPVSSIYKTDTSSHSDTYIPTTFYTTYTYYTTYLKEGKPLVSSREETVSNTGNVKATDTVKLTTDRVESISVPQETTFYTTYTYYTTLLKEGTTTVSTRKETVSNVLNKSLLSTVPLASTTDSHVPSITPSSHIKSYFTTYTYYTTFLRDGSSVISTRESTVTNVVSDNVNVITPTSSIIPTRSFTTYFTTLSSYYTLFNAGIPSVSTVYNTLTDVVALETSAQDIKPTVYTEVTSPSPSVTTYYTTYTYFTTVLSSSQPVVSTREIITSNIVTLADIKLDSSVSTISPFSILDSETVQPTAVLTKTYYTTYTFFTTYLSKGTPSVSTRLETVTNFASETISRTQNQPNKDEIVLTTSPTHDYSTKAHGYLTETTSIPSILNPSTLDSSFTHLTSLINGENSELKTSTHDALDEAKQPEIVESNTRYGDILPSTVVNTVYTTFTYYTTLFPNGSPVIETRYETKSNMLTVTISPSITNKVTGVTSDLDAAEGELHEKRVHPTPVITHYTTHTYIATTVLPDGGTGYITRHVVATATVEEDTNKNALTETSNINQCCTETTKYPYTFYTTYTYYTTRYHGDRPIVNTRYETITNVVKAPATTPLNHNIDITSTIDSLERLYPVTASNVPSSSKFVSAFTSVYEYASTEEKTPQFLKPRKEADVKPTDVKEDMSDTHVTESIDSTENTAKPESSDEMLSISVTDYLNSSNNSTENESTVSLTTGPVNRVEIFNFSDSSLGIATETSTESLSMRNTDATSKESMIANITTEVTTLSEDLTENKTETTSQETTPAATTEAPVRSIFTRRRNRPEYKPRPSFRSSTTTSTTPKPTPRSSNRATTTATTRSSVTVTRRNATRLLYRRPSLAPRVNPLQRFRPLRTTPSSEENNNENRRKKRSFFNIEHDYEVRPNVRKILSTSDEINEGIKNNDLISENNGNAEIHNNEKDNYPLGLIRSNEAKTINNGVTTIYGTEIHGTFINGVYAQVVQSKVRVHSDTPNEIATTPFLQPSISPSTPERNVESETNKVGLVSSKLSTAVRDSTTTIYTTNIYGTYIGDVYAHLAQTTTNIITPTPTTQNPYPTGLISSSIRSDENYGTTTLWTTHIYGTFVNNYYAHIASTFSNVFVDRDKNTAFTSQGINSLYAQATPDLRIPTQTARSIDNSKEYKTGLLSSIVSEDEKDGTTTQYITNVYGTYIGQQYAKHAQTTSKLILPTKSESQTRSIGLLSTLVNSVINGNTATIYKTEIFGTYIGQLYAQLARTSTEYSYIPKSSSTIVPQVLQKTGLLSSSVVRSEINAGTTTMHINEIYGTYIGNAYAHIAKSTSKVLKPSQSESKSPASDNSQKTGLISSSVKTEVNDGTTTLHIAEVHGTFVGNYYAHVARRTSTVLPFIPTSTNMFAERSTSSVNLKSEGLISSDVRTEINQGTTTLHTREVYGTFINGYYAHVARSSSNIITPTVASTSSSSGLISAITNSEVNKGILTLHTTEIYGTNINGFYAHIARSTSNIVSRTSTPTQHPLGVISATTSTEINYGDTTLHRTSVIGLETDGSYVQSVKVTSSIIYASHLYPETFTKTQLNVDSKTTSQVGVAKDDLDTARVNELDNGNPYISLTEDSDLGLKTPIHVITEIDLLSPAIKSEAIFIDTSNIMLFETLSTHVPTTSTIETKNISISNEIGSETVKLLQVPSSSETSEIQEVTKTIKKEERTSSEPTEDYNDYNDYVDNKTFRDKDSITSKPNVREQNPRKHKSPSLSSSRKVEPNDDYDDYAFEDDYDNFDGRKYNRKPTPSLASSRFKNTRESKRKSATFGNGDYDEYDDYDYHESEALQDQTSKSSETASTKDAVSSSVRIRPFVGRGRPTFTTTSKSSASKASFTIQFRRPSRTRNSRAFGHRSDSENDFDDELNEDDDEGDIEASEAVVTTATPQVLSFSRRKPFGNSRYQPPGRNSVTTSTTRPVSVGRNRRPFGRSSPTSPSPTPSSKDTVPDYDENTTEDDEFDDYDDFTDKKDPNRNRNFRSTRRPPSRVTRFGERRSASNKRGSFRHREEEETENDDFDATTPNYRNSRNRINQRKPSRGRYNRNNSPLLKSSFNSVGRDEDEDSQSLQPLNRIRGNNHNRRHSYNPRTRRPSKTVTETPTNKKPYLTVTSVVTTVKTLPIYHGFRTSFATLTTTALDTSVINPTQYTEVVSDGITKTVFYSKTGYPDGIENLHTTITEVVITTTSLASVKLVPIKIGFSTRTDTVTDIQVLTTLSTVYSTITPDAPQPTAFPQQFQPNFYPQLGHQNPDFGLLASANSFVTTQIVTATTVVPIILRGRTILSTLTTTSTAESIVVQTVRLPQIPSPAPYIPQPYFAFQPLTTLLTLYVTGEHGELKPVVTTVTVPLYQQPVFHTKVARSLQQNAVSEHTSKTANIMDLPISSSIVYDHSREVDIDTHYDKLLSSGLEEINDLSEKSNSQTQTEPLDSTRITAIPYGITTYDVTTISKGPLTEIYEQKVTINLNVDDESMEQNEIDRSKDIYGLESRYSFRKLHQFIEEDPVFRPQRDFTRLRRPPPGIILATITNPNVLLQPNTQSVPQRGRQRQFPPTRRPPVEVFNEGIPETENLNDFRGSSFVRRPLRRPDGNFRPFIERPTILPSSDENSNRAIPPILSIEPSRSSMNSESESDRIRFQYSNINSNRNNFNDFVGSPSERENDNGFQPISDPRGLRRGPGLALNELNPNADSSLRSRRLRVTRPINGDVTSGVVRRITKLRSPIISTPSPSSFENDATSSFDFIYSSIPSIIPEALFSSDPNNAENSVADYNNIPNKENEHDDAQDGNLSSRRTVVRRIRPSFIPGDGSGARRPVVVRRTRINDISTPSISESTTSVSEVPSSSLSDFEISITPAITEPSANEHLNTDADNDNADLNGVSKPPVKKIIRLRKPENGDQLPGGPRRRIVISRRPQDIIDANTVQARGPVNSVGIIDDGRRNNIISDKNHLIPNAEHDIDDFNKIVAFSDVNKGHSSVSSTKSYPITYFTTLTYYTTFLHGSERNYASRIAVFSNTIDRTLSPSLIDSIKMSNAQNIIPSEISTVHLASRTLGDTTTVVNLASRQRIYNSELFKSLNENPGISSPTPISAVSETRQTFKAPDTSNINFIAALPKTYLTLFTYSYTFYDGTNNRKSTRAETMTKVITDPSKFLAESAESYIDNDGVLNILPVTRTLHLGSREVEGTTTEVNLGLKTLIKFNNIKNVVIETMQPFQYITPSRTHDSYSSTPSTELPKSSSFQTLSSVLIESSYASANELFGDRNQDASTQTTPLVSADLPPNNSEEKRTVIKVTSIIHKPTGSLRSGVYNPRPGVRVRVRPVASRRLVPSELASSFDISYDVNEIASEYPEQPVSPQFLQPEASIGAIPTPVLEEPFFTNIVSSDVIAYDNELVSEEFDDDDHLATTEGAVLPSRKKLKVTVRRPQSESVSRTHTRFVLPSRFEITSKPRFYVVTRTGASGVASNTQRPFTVKISRKLKPSATEVIQPSTTVIYDTYTTLTSVPVIFGLDTSFRNVILTTSSPITVSFVPSPTYESDSTVIMPSTVILTYFTTTTFTIPYIVDDQTLYTTLEETTSRVVTSTLDVPDSLVHVSTYLPTEDTPTRSLYTSVEFGFYGPVTHTLSSPAFITTLYEELPVSPIATFYETPSRTLYETKTFYTTYTFFTTLFAGTEPVVSSSEQVITNVVTVPLSTEIPQVSSAVPEDIGPVTVFDTSETVITKTKYNTVTFYATLFSDTSSFVTPIEELQTETMKITETFTITRIISPTPSASFVPITMTTTFMPEPEPSVVVTQTLYTTFTNFVTLFQGSDTVVTNLEEIVSNVVTLTVPAHAASSFTVTSTPTLRKESYEIMTSEVTPVYTTREIVSTQTHYLTLFNNDESLLSSIEEVVTTYLTELVTPSTPSFVPVSHFTSPDVILLSSNILPSSSETYTPFTTTDETTSEISTYHPELVPSIRTIYSTLTFYTTYYSDTSSIVASQEEILTSYVTLFVPPSLITSTSETTTEVISPTSTIDPSIFVFTTTDYSTLTLYTTLFSGDEIVVISSEHVVPEVITATITPSSISPTETSTKDESVLTFLTTFTYYTTYFSGTDPVIASSESVVTQFVTIEAPPTPTATAELSIETTPVDETIIGVSTASAADIVSRFDGISSDIEIIGVSSAVATGIGVTSSGVETKIQIESMVHSEIGSTPLIFSPILPSEIIIESSTVSIEDKSSPGAEFSISRTVTDDFIIYSSEDSKSIINEYDILPMTTSSILTENVEIVGVDGKITSLFPSGTLLMVTGTDGFVTKMEEIDTPALSPVYIPATEEIVSSSTSEIKPATVIELSDLLGGNTALGGDIGLAIKDIVSLITGKKNKTEESATTEQAPDITEKHTTTTESVTETPESNTESTTVKESVDAVIDSTTEENDTEKVESLPKDLDYPIFVLPSSKTSEETSSNVLAPVYIPSDTVSRPTLETSSLKSTETKKFSSTISKSVSTSVITGARTIFIVPTKISSVVEDNRDKYNFETKESKNENQHESSIVSSIITTEESFTSSFEVSKGTSASEETITDTATLLPEIRKEPSLVSSDIKETLIASSMKSSVNDDLLTTTPKLESSVGSSVISGVRTVFFDSALNKESKSHRNTILSSAKDAILGRANAAINTTKSFTTVTKDGQTVISRTTSGATTIFFPGQIPRYTVPVISTRYVTSVESITRTLALTTTRTYYTRDSTLTVPSVYTTTIPPRTFVSTIIGSRTILGILPEPTENIQIHKTLEPSEHTTTVTTTTLIFNSIPSTVIRTLVLPTGVSTKSARSETASTYIIPDSNVLRSGTVKPAKRPEVGDSTVVDEDLSEVESSAAQPVQKARDETYLRAANPRIHDDHPDMRLTDEVHRPPIVLTEQTRPEDDPFLNGRNGVCDPKCQPYKKEVCKENDGLWTCQCRPGHARRDEHEICKEIQTFVVLLKVVKMGNESVDYNGVLADNGSQEFKEFVKSAKEGIADAYSITNVKDHIWDTEVNEILPAGAANGIKEMNEVTTVGPDPGVIVNFTLQVSKSVSGNLLEQELTRALQLTHMVIGDSLLLAAPLSQSVRDYDECLDSRQNDCSLRASCVNLEGSFTCECNEGFEDMDLNLPGRICLAKTENCNYCHGRGDCLRTEDDKTFCRCQDMFVGRRCEINGLVLAVALPTAVAVLILLLCAVLCCCRKCKRKSPTTNSGDPGSVFRGIALKGPVGGTLDRKAMIDTSSESSGEHGRKGHGPFDGYQESGDVTPHKSSKRSDISLNRSMQSGYTSPPVMIPRAKQPQVPTKPMNYTVYDGQVYVW